MQAIADTVHKSVGFTKNCFDLFNICITITVGLVCQGHLIGIGLGTVVAGIGVGRVIAIFNHGFKKKMDELAVDKDEHPDWNECTHREDVVPLLQEKMTHYLKDSTLLLSLDIDNGALNAKMQKN